MVRRKVVKVSKSGKKKGSVVRVRESELLKLKNRALLKVPEADLKRISRFRAFDFVLKYSEVTPEGRLIVNSVDIAEKAKARGERIDSSLVHDIIGMLQYHGADILKVSREKDSLISLIKPLSEKGRRVKPRDTAALRAIGKFAEKGGGGRLIVDVKAIHEKAKLDSSVRITYGKIYADAVYLRNLGYSVEIKNYSPPKSVLRAKVVRDELGVKRKKFEMHAIPKTDSRAVRYFLEMGESKEQVLSRFPLKSSLYWEDLIDKQIRKRNKKE